MRPGSVQIVGRVPTVGVIKRLNEEDLLFLNRLIVERLKLISQARATTLMTRFTQKLFGKYWIRVIMQPQGLD